MNNRIVEPKLRFPEFKENWVKTNFEKLLKYERPDKYIVDNTNYNSEGTPVLMYINSDIDYKYSVV